MSSETFFVFMLYNSYLFINMYEIRTFDNHKQHFAGGTLCWLLFISICNSSGKLYFLYFEKSIQKWNQNTSPVADRVTSSAKVSCTYNFIADCNRLQASPLLSLPVKWYDFTSTGLQQTWHQRKIVKLCQTISPWNHKEPFALLGSGNRPLLLTNFMSCEVQFPADCQNVI